LGDRLDRRGVDKAAATRARLDRLIDPPRLTSHLGKRRLAARESSSSDARSDRDSEPD
jgi:hypothetical protein